MVHEGDERKSEAGKERSGKKIGIECSRGCNRTERQSELERLRSRKQSENRKHETASSVLHRCSSQAQTLGSGGGEDEELLIGCNTHDDKY